MRTLLLRAAGAAALVLASAWAVRAASEGETRPSLTFAGTLLTDTGAPAPAPVDLEFAFKRAGAVVCAPSVAGIQPGKAGAFQVEIPLSTCPKHLLDASDVTLSVSAGGTAISVDQPIFAAPYAKYADQRGSPDCPLGYVASSVLSAPIKLCRRGDDEVVKVGTGAAAFWIDRFEASIWSTPDGSGTRYGEASADYPSTFPANGQYTAPLYALSRANHAPSAWVTWFQANEACRASGKRLAKSDEWARAGRHTPDPGSSSGADGACLTAGTAARTTGSGTACRSAAGAEDMVGNLAEWALDWQAMVDNTRDLAPRTAWPESYGGDGVWNISSRAQSGATFENLPAALALGGSFLEGVAAGLFSVDYRNSQAHASASLGFRCVVPR